MIEVREDDSDRREIIRADTADARMCIVIEEYSDRGSIETGHTGTIAGTLTCG
jgi:hypothetical protein